MIDRRDGNVLGRVPGRPPETQNGPPEGQSEQLVAHRMNDGSEVLVKSLQSGRTWWRFSTGPMSSEPVIKGKLVYATGSNGTLWALHLKGGQRVAWTDRVDGSLESGTCRSGRHALHRRQQRHGTCDFGLTLKAVAASLILRPVTSLK